MGLAQVSKACVVGVSHPKWMQRPIVVVELIKGNTIRLEEIKKHCLLNYNSWQCPVDLLFMDIPLTGTGKMSKKDLRTKLEEMNYVLPDLRTTQSKL